METKRYWLRGLVTGIILYILFLALIYAIWFVFTGGLALGALANGISVIAIYISPIIPLSLFLGWVYGKAPIIAILISVLTIIILLGLGFLIVNNTIFPKPKIPQPSVVTTINN